MFYYITYISLACDNITINCTRGSQCKVDEAVHQAYCEPSCDLDNGGCADNEVCSLLQPVTCVDPPCPSNVQCAGEFITPHEYVCIMSSASNVYI